MNNKTGKVFHDLMKKGWIDRTENPIAWECFNEEGVEEELKTLGNELNFETVRMGDRIYIVPTQENDLFLKNNVDYRRDIKASSEVRAADLYLLNYLAVYLIYLIYKGEGDNPKCRDYIEKENFVKLFTEHCKEVENKALGEEIVKADYSENFIQLAKAWLQKPDGKLVDNKAFDSKFGIVNKILIKLKADGLFNEKDGNKIEPTRKMNDLMPYFLKKERVAAIQNFFNGEDKNATNL